MRVIGISKSLGRVAVVAVVAATLAASAGTVWAEPNSQVPVQPVLPFPIPPLPPELDPGFYQPDPAVVAAKQPGEIIAAREVHLSLYSVLPYNIDAWQLSFRSTNTRGEPIAAVTTVAKPRGGNNGLPRNLLSYQFAIDSSARYCSPSYELQLASVPPNITGALNIPVEFINAITGLGLGWALNMPDYDATYMAFGAGPLNARITLDSIRAAENFDLLGLDGVRTKVGLVGYSGGAIATGHSAELKASYAPELNVVGVVEGGIPVDLVRMIDMASNNVASGLLLSGMLAAAREYPDLQTYYDQHMNGFGKAMAVVKQPFCLWGAAVLPFVNLRGLFDRPDAFSDPVPAAVFEQLRLGHSTPDMPVFMFQSNPDWIVPVGPVNDLYATYCKDPRAHVEYVRDNFSEHFSLLLIAWAKEITWLKDRFDGVPVPDGCVFHDEGSMALDQSTWPEWLRKVVTVVQGIFQYPIGN
ncbi:lipase family protein [Nocardia pseudobrasiliensis]|uniref:Triacylglycerol lipase n=1 Tax=Nocardia pseudobrasiliensis TaxID=45979 RepID=A0A370IB16_9NOCA|nr:lipase family protein [Nocardia pseudobrasiliensis]RDI67912.1 triacylglycerol lipase [Nocardia pseudobrasiliensis]